MTGRPTVSAAKTHASVSFCGACRAERSQSVCAPSTLQLEECLSAELVPTPELIQGYVKKVGQLSKRPSDGASRGRVLLEGRFLGEDGGLLNGTGGLKMTNYSGGDDVR